MLRFPVPRYHEGGQRWSRSQDQLAFQRGKSFKLAREKHISSKSLSHSTWFHARAQLFIRGLKSKSPDLCQKWDCCSSIHTRFPCSLAEPPSHDLTGNTDFPHESITTLVHHSIILGGCLLPLGIFVAQHGISAKTPPANHGIVNMPYIRYHQL